MTRTHQEVRPVAVASALLLACVSGCAGQGYVGDRCEALSGADDVRSLPTDGPVDPANGTPVTRISGSPSPVGLRAFTPEFACCSRQELDSSRTCEVDCAAWRTTIGAASLARPYAGELCNGDRYGSATCTAFYSRSTGKLVGTFSFCYD